MGWQYQNGQVVYTPDKEWTPPLQTPQNTTNNPAYGATPTLPGAGGEYVPPGSPVARTNGAIDAANAAPAMTSPLTGASGAKDVVVSGLATEYNPTTGQYSAPAPPAPPAPITPQAKQVGIGDITGDINSPLPASPVTPTPPVAPLVSDTGGVSDDQRSAIVAESLGEGISAKKDAGVTDGLWPNTGGPEASASGEFNVDLPGLPSGREDLAQLLTMQQLGQQQGNPMLDLLQGLSVQNLAGPFGLSDSEEQMAYQRGENMLKQSEAEQQRQTIEEMNRRGILTSGITVDQLQKGVAGGQLARQNLLSDLLLSNAQNRQAQRQSALGTAGSMYGVGEAGKQQNFGNLMGLLSNAQGWQGQQFGQQQQVYNDALNNYYKQTQLESTLNSQARAEEMQPYQLLMQLAGMGDTGEGAMTGAGSIGLGNQGQALANQGTGTDWGSIIGSLLPSLLKFL